MRYNKLAPFLLLFVMSLGAACARIDAPSADSKTSPASRTLTVLAAASLKESFTELAQLFEAQHPGVTVNISFAGSQQLAQQLNQGAPADVFASASTKYMDSVVDSGRVNRDDAKIFVTNRLVVIFPKQNPGGLQELQDLARPGLKLDLADQSVPVGNYTLDFLDKASGNQEFGPNFKADVLRNVVSYENNVKVVVTKVALGEADAGVVYVSDITADVVDMVGWFDIPDELNTIATYPIAPVLDGRQPELARAFVDFILSPAAQQIFAKYNFVPALIGLPASD